MLPWPRASTGWRRGRRCPRAQDEWHSAAARVRLKPPVPAVGDAMVRALLCQLGNNPAAWEIIVSGGLTARQVLTNARSLAAMAVPGAQVAAHAALPSPPTDDA